MSQSEMNYGLIAGVPTDADAATLRKIEGYYRGLTKNPVVTGASDTWAIARAFVAGGDIDYAISWNDIAKDEIWAAHMLDLMGVGGDDLLFFSYLYSQSGQTWPWLKSAFERGAKLATGMPTQWDAYRLEMYLRLLSVRVVFGVTGGVLDGLEGAGHDIAKVFATPSHVLALADAWPRLSKAGLKPWKLHWLGPILALDPCDGRGAHFDHDQWVLESAQGRLLISNRRPRMTHFDRTDIGLQGVVENVGGEPRLFLDA